MKIILFEDNQSDNLCPVGLFRPLFDVYIGSVTLRELVSKMDIPVLTITRDHFIYGDNKNADISSSESEPLMFLNASIVPNVLYL